MTACQQPDDDHHHHDLDERETAGVSMQVLARSHGVSTGKRAGPNSVANHSK
jgi:hypothetical protein